MKKPSHGGWFEDPEGHRRAALKRYHNRGLIQFSENNIKKAILKFCGGLSRSYLNVALLPSIAQNLLILSGVPITTTNIQLAIETINNFFGD